MDFSFSDDQRLFQSAVHDFLAGEQTPELLRKQWESPTGREPSLWPQLAELGVLGALVPEEQGGMGLDEIDAVLLFEEMGRSALSEPVIDTCAVAAPLLRELGGALASEWLPKIVAGEAKVAVGHPDCRFVSDADAAALLLLPGPDGALHARDAADVECIHEPTTDPGRRVFTVRFDAKAAAPAAVGAAAAAHFAAAMDRGALACAAELLGVTDQLIAMGAEYASQRKQFGVPIGSFQAVKHHLADLKVKVEYARPLVYRAAHSVATGDSLRSRHVSMAKEAAYRAAYASTRASLQVYGALGYTWEQDLHIWMRRAWSLGQDWGRERYHRTRVGDEILAAGTPLGPDRTYA